MKNKGVIITVVILIIVVIAIVIYKKRKAAEASSSFVGKRFVTNAAGRGYWDTHNCSGKIRNGVCQGDISSK